MLEKCHVSRDAGWPASALMPDIYTWMGLLRPRVAPGNHAQSNLRYAS